jgi:hypothetical protein
MSRVLRSVPLYFRQFSTLHGGSMQHDCNMESIPHAVEMGVQKMTTTSTRRAILAGAAAIPALALPAIAKPARTPTPPEGFTSVIDAKGKLWFKADEPDPIFAAIELHTRLEDEVDQLSTTIAAIEDARPRSQFPRPNTLVSWRGYSAIGFTEIERRRDELLAEGKLRPETIESEYQTKKAEERALLADEEAWRKQLGTHELHVRLKTCSSERLAGMEALA